jgi:D-beta-D-heptose 7-phosphate kinase/D-beta-D-heptose 1-phosphate adenosyltransferase
LDFSLLKNKLKTLDELSNIISEIKADGRKVIFTNGCFDILHVGHVRYLQAARSLGDCLVIAINSDKSVRGLKGEKRPIVPQNERAELLAALECVDYLTIFEEPDPLNAIKSIKPSSLVKGGDWSEDQIIGGDFVKSIGGQVDRIPYIDGASTTNIIEEIIERYCRA